MSAELTKAKLTLLPFHLFPLCGKWNPDHCVYYFTMSHFTMNHLLLHNVTLHNESLITGGHSCVMQSILFPALRERAMNSIAEVY